MCPGSSRLRLNCSPPINLGPSNGIDFSSLAAFPGGFLAAWTSDRIELKEVRFDGGVSALVSRAGVASGQVAVDSKGSNWALVWISAGANTATCVTSSDPGGGQTVTAPSGGLDIISAALSVGGGVAIAAKRGSVFVGAQQAQGCPSSLAALGFPLNPEGVSVVATTDPLGDGFRYVYTGGGDAGSITQGNVIVGALDGGLITTSYFSLTNRPYQNLAIPSTDGTHVFVTYDGEGPNLGSTKISLYGTPSDLSGTTAQATVVSQQAAGWWGASQCGAGCVVQSVTPYRDAGPPVLSFFRDTATLDGIGQYDLLCEVPAYLTDSTTLSLAYSEGRLGALVTTSFNADLYICDAPQP
jgi:hypothetical protein